MVVFSLELSQTVLYCVRILFPKDLCINSTVDELFSTDLVQL